MAGGSLSTTATELEEKEGFEIIFVNELTELIINVFKILNRRKLYSRLSLNERKKEERFLVLYPAFFL